MTRCLVLLLSMSLAIGHPFWAGASDESSYLRVTGTKVNVRVEPSLKARVLFQVIKGDVLKSLEKSGKWFKIETSRGKQGYIYSTLVTPTAAPKKAKAERRPESRVRAPEAGVETTRRGPSKKTLLIGGGVAAAGIAALLLLSGGEDESKTDSDGDGFTPEQGDCDDTRPEVNPNGTVTAEATSDIAGQSVDCTTSSTWRVSVINSSCTDVTVTGLQVSRTVVEQIGGISCESSSAIPLTPSQSTVPAGETVTIYELTVASGCCVDPETCSGSCRFNRVYNVNTSAGNLRTTPVQYQIEFGPQCAACPSTLR